MSVLIKDMDVPERCAECRFLEGTTMDGLCHAARKWFDDEYWNWYYFEEDDIDDSKPLNCPLVEIPPHGRLIDENDVLKSAEELRKSPWYNYEQGFIVRKCGFEVAIDLTVKDAPTIIDAEMEEDATEER